MKVKDYEAGELHKLPSWVKCVRCGLPPIFDDWLVEIIPHSNALIHMSCAGQDGKVAGLNIGIEKGD